MNIPSWDSIHKNVKGTLGQSIMDMPKKFPIIFPTIKDFFFMNISNKLFRSTVRFSANLLKLSFPAILGATDKTAPFDIIVLPDTTESVIRKMSPLAYFLISNYIESDQLKLAQSAIQNKLKHFTGACMAPLGVLSHEYIHLSAEPKIICGQKPKLFTNKSSLNPVPWSVMWTSVMFQPTQMALLVTLKNIPNIFNEKEGLKFWSLIADQWTGGIIKPGRNECLEELIKKLFENFEELVYMFTISLDLVQTETQIEMLKFWSNKTSNELKLLLKTFKIQNRDNPLEPIEDFEFDFFAVQTLTSQAKFNLQKFWANNDNFTNSKLFPKHVFSDKENLIVHLCILLHLGLNRLFEEIQIIVTIQATALIQQLPDTFSETKIKSQVVLIRTMKFFKVNKLAL